MQAPVAEPVTAPALTEAQFAAFLQAKQAPSEQSSEPKLTGRLMWDSMPWVFDCDEEGNHSAAALEQIATQQQPRS